MAACTLLQRLRGPKLFNMSIFDWVASILGAFLIGKFLLKLEGARDWTLFILAWVVFGVAVHKLFKVNTQFGFYLGLNPRPKREACT